ncbi:MAG: bifunctional hydroxymethylpyrimidine kinase/phosphomethylpyrimidine kinase, partial [Burkholderiales bacterium]
MSPPRSRPTRPVVLTIAGFDPSSGAGATADLKTIAAHGCYGVSCLTALTVQSTAGVSRVEPISAEVVSETLWELAYDFNFEAAKIGMLATRPVVDAVARFLGRVKPPWVVLDPVLESSSGAALLDAEGRVRLSKRLLRMATVITPNLAEAAALTGLRVESVAEMKSAASRLHRMGARNVVITGGHGKRPVDVLSMVRTSGIEQVEFAGDRVLSTSTHGTGCAFSSAVACNLALGRSLREAVGLAKEYVTEAIRNAYPVGQGVGPVNHFYDRDEHPPKRRTASHPQGRRVAARGVLESAARRK